MKDNVHVLFILTEDTGKETDARAGELIWNLAFPLKCSYWYHLFMLISMSSDVHFNLFVPCVVINTHALNYI